MSHSLGTMHLSERIERSPGKLPGCKGDEPHCCSCGLDLCKAEDCREVAAVVVVGIAAGCMRRVSVTNLLAASDADIQTGSNHTEPSESAVKARLDPTVKTWCSAIPCHSCHCDCCSLCTTPRLVRSGPLDHRKTQHRLRCRSLEFGVEQDPGQLGPDGG